MQAGRSVVQVGRNKKQLYDGKKKTVVALAAFLTLRFLKLKMVGAVLGKGRSEAKLRGTTPN
jgi:hypothetical protein